MVIDEPNFLRPRQVAAMLCVTTQSVHNYVAAGLLPATRIGGHLRYKLDDVRALIAAGQLPDGRPAPKATKRVSGPRETVSA